MKAVLTRLVVALAIAAPVVVSAQSPVSPPATPAAASPIPSLVGNWQGALTFGTTVTRVGLVVTAASGGGYAAQLVVVDQEAIIPVQQVVLTGTALHLEATTIKGTYDGILSANGQELTGTLTQDRPLPLNFVRVARLDTPPPFDESVSASIRAVIDTYFRSFTLNDFDALRATFQPPFIAWAIGNPPAVFATAEEASAGLRRTRDGLASTDYAVSRAARMSITPLSSTSALVDIHWRRDKKDGSLFGEGAEILTVVRTPNGWKINGNMARQLSQYGKSF